ncbi:MAG: glycosyltransferase family 2 protein [Vampirovibrionales bacterium]|nr:glycosyltransferase family 2 protein [Vampirovibrionales bacterium]
MDTQWISQSRQQHLSIANTPRIGVVIVNYKGVEDTIHCLQSLSQSTYQNFQVFVIDNDSQDHSVSTLKALQESKNCAVDFTLIESDVNLGFSGGNNIAISAMISFNDALSTNREKGAQQPQMGNETNGRQLPYDYVWLLNNDATADPHCLKNMVDEAGKTGGLVGSLVLYPDKTYQRVGTQINWKTGGVSGYAEGCLKDGMALECLSGASMLIPVSVIKRIGLMDESYFLYFEDAEYCLRAAEKRIPVTLSLKARVYHHEGKSTGKHSLATQYYYHRNRLRLLAQYADGNERFSIGLYTSFRMLRSVVKSFLSPAQPEKKASLAVQKLAVRDFKQGVSGPCPHNLQALQ